MGGGWGRHFSVTHFLNDANEHYLKTIAIGESLFGGGGVVHTMLN